MPISRNNRYITGMKYTLFIALALLFVGCSAQSPVEGEWKIVHMVQGGMDAQMEKYGSKAGMSFTGDYYTYRLTESGNTRIVEGTVKVDEATHELVLRSEITGTPTESTYSYDLKGDNLTLTLLGTSAETVMQLERIN